MNLKYKDKLIEITDREVIFRRYYFPFCTAKRVPLEKIGSIGIRQPSLSNGSWRIWGTGNFGVWFPLDFQRPKRDAIFIASLRSASMRIGFTVENSIRATETFAEIGILNESSIIQVAEGCSVSKAGSAGRLFCSFVATKLPLGKALASTRPPLCNMKSNEVLK